MLGLELDFGGCFFYSLSLNSSCYSSYYSFCSFVHSLWFTLPPCTVFLLLVFYINVTLCSSTFFLYFVRFTVFHIFNILPILVTLHTLFSFLFLFFLVVYSCNLLILQDIVLSFFFLPLCVLSPFELLFPIFFFFRFVLFFF